MELQDLELKVREEGITKFTRDVAALSVEQQMVALDSLQELIYKGHRELTPMYPLVLVMVLRKQQVRASGIELTESQQNKPMHEGIVLATWNEKIIERGTITRDGERLTRCEVQRSELKAGDHVLFHHWAGMPIHGFDDLRFRMVREREWHETQQGGIVGVLHYSEPILAPLLAVINLVESAAAEREDLPLLEAKIRDRYVVIDKETQSVTLSGR